MRYLALFFAFLLMMSDTQISYAAFPIKPSTAPKKEKLVNKLEQRINQTSTKVIGKPLLKPQQDNVSGESGWEGYTAFGLGALGLVAIIAGSVAAGAGGLVALGILMGIGAIVIGALGFNKPNRGLAIAGFVLGVVEVSLLLLVLILALIIIGSYRE